MRTNKLLSATLGALLLSSYVLAMPHIKPGTPGAPRDYVRQPLTAEALRSMVLTPDQRAKLITSPTGTKKIAVILANFTGAGGATNGVYQLSAADQTAAEANFNYLKNFYKEASYGSLNLVIEYCWNGGRGATLSGMGATPFTMPNSLADYGVNDSGATYLVIHALQAANAQYDVSFPAYDAVMVLHAGYGEESTSDSNGVTNIYDIWSCMTSWSPYYYNLGDGIVVPARQYGMDSDSTRGVLCHEFGHVLGFPDLYQTETGGSSVGKWCLMDGGSWNDNGAQPASPSVWMRQRAGWLSPTTVNSSQQITGMNAFETHSDGTYRIPILGSSEEYFLVCYSSQSAYNSAPAGEGVLIWHVDEGIIDGTNFLNRMLNNTVNVYSHNTVDIVPADGDHPRTQSSGGYLNDPWPGTKSVFTSHDSDSYSGMVSGITLANFQFSGGLAGFYATTIGVDNKLRIDKLVNYPNPAGSGYYHPNSAQGTLTTFAIKMSRPSQTLKLVVYNLAGELVTTAETDDFTLDVAASTDYEWVYKFDWDGRNDDGNQVAPGAYLYRLKADDAVKTGSMAVVR